MGQSREVELPGLQVAGRPDGQTYGADWRPGEISVWFIRPQPEVQGEGCEAAMWATTAHYFERHELFGFAWGRDLDWTWVCNHDFYHWRVRGTMAFLSARVGVLLAATALPPLLWVGVHGRRAWVRRRRGRLGLCRRCGYDLTGNVSGRCSECGADAAEARGAMA